MRDENVVKAHQKYPKFAIFEYVLSKYFEVSRKCPENHKTSGYKNIKSRLARIEIQFGNCYK